MGNTGGYGNGGKLLATLGAVTQFVNELCVSDCFHYFVV